MDYLGGQTTHYKPILTTRSYWGLPTTRSRPCNDPLANQVDRLPSLPSPLRNTQVEWLNSNTQYLLGPSHYTIPSLQWPAGQSGGPSPVPAESQLEHTGGVFIQSRPCNDPLANQVDCLPSLPSPHWNTQVEWLNSDTQFQLSFLPSPLFLLCYNPTLEI